jgi:urea transporter
VILSSSRGAAVPLILQRQLVGIGQIYFQASPIFGTVLLLCLYLNAPPLALGCALGVSSASLAAWAMRLPSENRHNGIYSFNGALTGIGLCAGYRLDGALLVWIAASGPLTAALTQTVRCLRIPPLTLPFVLMMWLAMATGQNFGLQPLTAPAAAGCGSAPLNYLFCSLSQATFVGLAPLGMLMWASMSRYDWHLAMSALAGASISWLTFITGAAAWPESGIAAHATGAGINSALAMLALGSRQCHLHLRLAGAALSIALSIAFGSLSLPYFTLPFILATWVILSGIKRY